MEDKVCENIFYTNSSNSPKFKLKYFYFKRKEEIEKMEIDIDKASLQDIISMIQVGRTDQEIAAMKNYNSGSPVYSRLKIAGADKSSKKWNFTNINQSMLEHNFWDIREEKKSMSEKTLDNNEFSEEQIDALKIIADSYINQCSDSETEPTNMKCLEDYFLNTPLIKITILPPNS